MDLGEVGSMRELGITESFKLKKQVVVSASEAAEMILRYVPLFSTMQVLLLIAVSTTFSEVHQDGGRVCRACDRLSACIHTSTAARRCCFSLFSGGFMLIFRLLMRRD